MGYKSTTGYICSIYLECVRCIHIIPAVMRGSIPEEGLKIFFHECSMRNAICPEPCWSNNSISPITHSDNGTYLTAV